MKETNETNATQWQSRQQLPLLAFDLWTWWIDSRSRCII